MNDFPTCTHHFKTKYCRRCLHARGASYCVPCDSIKPVDEFYSLHGPCKPCAIQKAAQWNSTNKEARRAIVRRDNAKGARARTIKHLYDWTDTHYQAALTIQEDRCAICGGPPTRQHFSIDHDHESGLIRGLLCQPCNAGLGHFKESLAVLQKAVAYLSAPPLSSHGELQNLRDRAQARPPDGQAPDCERSSAPAPS